MATMNVSLPETMKKWVNSQVKTGRYGNASDYVRDLIRRDQDQINKITEIRAQLELDAKNEKADGAKDKPATSSDVKTKSVKAKGEIPIGEKAKSRSTKGRKKQPSMASIRKNVLAQVKKNWRPSE